MRDRLIARIHEQMERDPSVLFLTGDLGFGVLDSIQADFSDRFINAGVSEQNMMGFAAGLALEGHRPYLYSIANFPTLRALQQLRNDVVYHRLPVTIISVGGGLGYGSLGASHHASDDLGALLALPGLDVLAPAIDAEVDSAAAWAAEATGPTVVRVDRGAAAPCQALTPPVIGRATLIREGRDATVFTYGNVLAEVLTAADLAATNGVSIRIETMPALRPFDTAAVIAAAERGPVAFVEDHCRVGGLATTAAQALCEAQVTPKGFAALNLGDDFVRHVGSTDFLRAQCGLDATSIAQRVQSLVWAAS